MRTYQHCDHGMAGIVWPDGGALLDQPAALVTAFGVIAGALHRYSKKGG